MTRDTHLGAVVSQQQQQRQQPQAQESLCSSSAKIGFSPGQALQDSSTHSSLLASQGEAATLVALHEFKGLLASYPVQCMAAVATAAVRDAIDAGPLLQAGEAILGSPIRVLSGERYTSVEGRSERQPASALLSSLWPSVDDPRPVSGDHCSPLLNATTTTARSQSSDSVSRHQWHLPVVAYLWHPQHHLLTPLEQQSVLVNMPVLVWPSYLSSFALLKVSRRASWLSKEPPAACTSFSLSAGVWGVSAA